MRIYQACKESKSTRNFLAILERCPRAFQIKKVSAVNPLNWEICYSAQLWHFQSIKIQISFYTQYIAI